jgi:hypothetical protein
MKLLVLGLFVTIVLISQIYILLINKEYFNVKEYFSVEEENAENQMKMLSETDDYYKIRSQGAGSGMLVTKPGISNWLGVKNNSNNLKTVKPKIFLEQSKVDKQVLNCDTMKDCGDLDNSPCGYCDTTKEFSLGDKKGSTTSACPKGPGGMNAWSTSAEKCRKIRERAICKKAKSCGDLYGDAEKLCGYCPTTGEAMVKKKSGNIFVPKYSEDTCNNGDYGLISADKCLSFAKDHPCITPYHTSGPHSIECLKKLWKNSECSKEQPYDTTFKHLATLLKPYKEIGKKMTDTFNKTFSHNYQTAKANSLLCHGNYDKLNACKNKYKTNKNGISVFPKECYEKKYKSSGCTTSGEGWKDIQNDLITNILKKQRKQNLYGDVTNDNYTSQLEKISNTATNGSVGSATLYEKKKNSAEECYGEIPPPPPPVKIGDYVVFKNDTFTIEGTVFKDLGHQISVMWEIIKPGVLSKNILRDGKSLEEQKKYFGWPGIKASSSKYGIGNSYGNILKSSVTVTKRCAATKSQCKKSCNDIITDLSIKYPRPRDCIVSDWSKWSKCSKTCGGGIKKKSRTILYPPKYGGNPCPTLKAQMTCNTQECLNPNFKKVDKLKKVCDFRKKPYRLVGGWIPRYWRGRCTEKTPGWCIKNPPCEYR